MNKPVLYIVFLIFSLFGKAQENLVPNGSFEEYNWCPVGISDFSVSDWYLATWGTCDYFNECSFTDANVPNNYFGFQSANDGYGYVGFGIVFDSMNESNREYIQVELTTFLENGKTYNFSCYINKADSSSVCVKDIGVALSAIPIGGNYLHRINFIPQYTNSNSTISCNDNSWNKIEFNFIAKGGEKYLTIGCFDEDILLDTLIVSESIQGLFSYYFIDNVSLYESTIEIPNVFSPNGDGINDYWEFPLYYHSNIEIQILNRWGQIVANCNNGLWDGKTDLGKECLSGIYYYKSSNPNLTGFIHLVR